MALLVLAITWMHATIVLTSWASSVALLLTAPDARSTRPYRIFGCHVVSALIGAGLALVSGNAFWMIALAVPMALLVAHVFDIVHPSAITNAAIAFTISTPTRSFLLIALLGAVILGAAGSILRKRSVVWPDCEKESGVEERPN
jgi:CBS-domain-containing membrane protein